MNDAQRDPFIRGASFLMQETKPDQVFTIEEINDEQKMIAKTTADYVTHEVLPVLDQIEAHQFDHSVQLIRKAGELGLIGASVPEKYGGLGLGKISTTLIGENIAQARSFALTFGGNVGIGTLPIVFFGTEEQKEKYLPQLASGEWIAAYALTEPSSGSDALGAKTIAKLSEDGQDYLLTGEKQWITNSAFADVFIVYAKVDGEKFTAFIVERNMEGLSTGPEEKKMGIKGSSTRTLILNEVKVPVENVLGEVGKGHVIAFNILNIGRFSLAAACVGSCKRAVELSVQYAKNRKQFNTAIADFPLIKSKMADMNIRTFVGESIVYRTAGLMEQRMSRLTQAELDDGQEVAHSIAEYAIECSINKVYCSEALDAVIDEAVQIHGGYGFMSEYEVENIYRDARINRIFEGTNEINRLLIPATLMRKSLKGELDLFQTASGLQQELMMYMPTEHDDQSLAWEKEAVRAAKKLFLMLAGLGFQKYQQDLEQEQELLAHIADMVIEIYAMESTVLRTEKEIEKNGPVAEKQKRDMTKVYVHETMQRLSGWATEAFMAMEEGDQLRTLLAIVRKLTKAKPFNSINAKREIADRVISAEKYHC